MSEQIQVIDTSTKMANSATVTGPDVDALTEYMVGRIRPQSKEFYRKELHRELTERGDSLVDVHAGCGTRYRVRINKC